MRNKKAVTSPQDNGPGRRGKPLASELSHLLRISRAIAGQLDCPAVLSAFSHELEHLFEFSHVDIVILCTNNEDHYFFETGIKSGWQDFFTTSLQPINKSPVRAVLRGEIPYILTENALEDPRLHFEGAMDQPIFAANLRSRMIVPMLVQSSVIGSLNISSHQFGAYSKDDLEIAGHCADLLAPYIFALTRAEDARVAIQSEGEARATIEQMRVGALQLTQGMEQERRRVAMDLHDQTLGDLASLARKAARIRRTYGQSDPDIAALELGIIECLGELRRIVDDLKPGLLDLFGFAAAVEAYLEKAVQDADPPILISFVDDSEGAFDRCEETVRTALYRITQEAINNAVRHSQSQRLDVTLGATEENIVITVKDFGIGLCETGHHTRGGLSNMLTRAALIGASVEMLEGANAKGTSVTITVERGF